eukprot:5478641-Amphidinium_carterae.1
MECQEMRTPPTKNRGTTKALPKCARVSHGRRASLAETFGEQTRHEFTICVNRYFAMAQEV